MREGASSYIIIDGEKATKKRKRGRSSASAEYFMHRYVHTLLSNNDKYKLLFTPRPFECGEREYSMEVIDDGYLIMTENFREDLKTELRLFYCDMARHGFFPHDFELYLQTDGQIAMVDFEKFGEWVSRDEVVIDNLDVKFDARMLLCSPLLPAEAPEWISCIKDCVKIYNRDGEEIVE